MDGGDIVYSYKQLTDPNSINMLKKAHGKFLIPLIVSMVSMVNIILALLFYFATKDMFLKTSYPIYILLALIVLQIILGVTIYGKYINRVVIDLKKSHGEIEINFNEKGLTIKKNETLIEISWEGIKEVRIYDGYIIFVSKNSCVLNRIMTFDSFNVERDVIISDIEKYKEVRWYYNEF